MNDRILTVDLEYDFETQEVKNLKQIVPKLLDYFDLKGIKATFFVLGEIVEQYPQLIKKIGAKHEIASHGYDHSYLTKLTLDGVDNQLRKSKRAIENLGFVCKGFRAPYFMWPKDLFKLLKENGYKYDSSISSFFPGRYSNLKVPIKPHVREGVIELPISNFVSKFVPSGLSYYRIAYPVSKLFKLPYLMYLHPCEFLKEQPKNDINGVVKRVYARNQGKKAVKIFTEIIDNSSSNWITCDDFIKKYVI